MIFQTSFFLLVVSSLTSGVLLVLHSNDQSSLNYKIENILRLFGPKSPLWLYRTNLVPLLTIFAWSVSAEHCDEHWPANAGTAAVAATNNLIFSQPFLCQPDERNFGLNKLFQIHQIQIKIWNLTFCYGIMNFWFEI